MRTLPYKTVSTLYAEMRVPALATGVTDMDKSFFKQRVQFIDDEMMYYPVTKVGGKYFPLDRLVDNKAMD